MSSGPTVFLGTFFALSASWLGFVLAPQLQIGSQKPVESKNTGDMYPQMRAGLARQGEQVYRANGCFYCHTQQVRPKGFGADFERNWGGRNGVVQSVDQDYLYDRPVMLGNQRVGPDLANFGTRTASMLGITNVFEQTNSLPLLMHLYNPRSTMPNSVMPPYPYLFEKQKLGEKPSADALVSLGSPGYEMVPTRDGRALVAYLLSLHSDAVLFEAPPFPSKTNAMLSTNAVSTNVVSAAGATNTPANAPTNSTAK